MKKILSLVLISALGGVLTLGGYKLFLEEKNTVVVENVQTTPNFLPTSNINTLYNTTEAPDFVSAAENTVNAVVHVKNMSMSSGPMTFEDLFFGGGSQRPQLGTGSGVIINANGYIITNNHVIKNAQKLSVTLNNNKIYEAEVIGADPKTDIALLKIEADDELPYVTFGDSDNAKIGEWVLAVGNPFNLTSTVTAGIISAKARDLSGKSTQSFIQTDAAVNPGNSGGALVNTNGELIGINTAISSQTGSYVGYSFAVPSNIAKRVIEDIMEYGNVQNGILGIRGNALNSKYSEELGVNETEGVYIGEVVEDSGADRAGLRQGDIIVKVNNTKISKFSDLTGQISSKRPNDIVQVTFSRDGNIKTVPVTLFKNNVFTMPLVGEIKDVKKVDLKKFKVSNGVKIIKLNEKYNDYWTRNGVAEGCIITSVNDVEVNSIEDVQKALKNQSDYDSLRLELINTKGEKDRFNFR
ncbi:trypsin-like peptidase domain-containing protein [Seonamhaeicola marinus]|uniref:PDZ domain-containing protein n=1 Tax=Seonamhaeicola marinus TaxID=1912246 RepID=A0A5D0HJA9_9FLAO|nr:trypsin-like peptidase domain-containing protein [Seonamhaeicola marinus]TYA71473.1 PDZ domain-containing protein [Seonamhaeicola marinus]